ncbi:ATP synthase subunit delta, mitochondrial [Pogoniulus pusillus]|uniref:ATP synthase subunit delta, mitochondrial n=1 Tax=Pogoniulus pusillus TaxID=488313 RepID=UPI0030B92AD1
MGWESEAPLQPCLTRACPPAFAVSSGSVTVNADSTVQVLAEEAVTMDMLDLATAKSNLEKAVSEMAAASDEAAKAEAQIKVEANEALVKALE